MTTSLPWRLQISPDIASLSARAADIVGETLHEKPDAVLTLPTGATPLHLFDILAARCARGEIDFSRATFFSLDDYLGLHGTEPNSLSQWLRTTLLDRLNLDPARTFLVPAGAGDPERAAAEYDTLIAAHGGFDLAVLGIGANGHIAFNEPGTVASSRTRVVELTPETVAQASAYWDDTFAIPHRAMTVGIANLLEARRIVLLASGAAKAAALRRGLEEAPSPDVPASFLQLAGERLDVLADQEAAAELTIGV